MSTGLFGQLIEYRGPQAARFTLALVLVLAVIAVVIIAMTQGISPADMSQYVAPLTGLAGAAVGYWFGKSDDQPGGGVGASGDASSGE